MTVTKLATVTGVSRETLSAYENGRSLPQAPMLAALARALNVPAAFLAAEEIAPLDETAVSFRSLSKRSATQRNAALAAGRLGVDFMKWVDERFTLPQPDVPTLPDHSPEIAADIVRARWGLGNQPVSRIIHLLEYHGVRVLCLPTECETIDAFSVEVDSIPHVFLSNSKTPERIRFDAAHELGHLVLHSEHREPGSDKTDEEAANAFAAAFLMPGPSILAEGLHNADAELIVRAKRIWNVSAMALARRLNELDLLTEWRYRDACVQLARQGFRKSEPDGMEIREGSRLLPKVLAALRSERIPLSTIATDLAISVDELRSYFVGLAPTLLRGGGTDLSTPTRPALHLIKTDSRTATTRRA
ncbi:MAG TPA: ImmA/IrrE family metallo-endopeptidase [Candidatus Stackebrandtia faecavium]|nr:ImmA/IrrE family metallo-endopeptidase [Candidatus Stackebrandtia faecavium]